MRGLRDKTVVVAGGGGGIGSGICERLAEEGARVVVADVAADRADDVAARIRAGGGTAVSCDLDICEPESVRAVFMFAASRFHDAVRVAVTVAANMSTDVLGRDTDLTELPLEIFDPTMHTNLLGTLLCIREAVPHMSRAGGGSIVCTSSAAAFLGEESRPLYAASKAGLNALVRHTASRWGRDGIRANAVAPGLVPRQDGSTPPGFAQEVLSTIRSPRLGTPADIGAATAFLASDDAAWINGQVISVDGGWLMR